MAENKKDSFTFSDKIKNSKPAFNPFSKRVPSKIGSNGKPKKTLFERTRRDAPFFVAAAAALLMLPFLYKYSGSVNEGVIIPPGSEDSVFDPERFGFEPSVEDPNGQIAQLTGRDPLSLIKGWGSADEEAGFEDEPYEDFRVQDGLDDNYNVPPASSSPRSYAPAATRAAFKRQATPIKELGDASLNMRGGVGGSFGRFGGANLKAAAKKDSSGGPKQGIKPVSLQPLRAADNPTRSYFGQTGAAQARASREAMGKANALQALSDAMFNPVKSPGFGGIGTGEFAPGGGAAEIKHTLDYKGITPWWWDMMKERSQEAWRWKYFLWRNNLVVPLVKKLAELAGVIGYNLGCCIIMGNSDCDPDTFLGASSQNSTEATCCGIKESNWGSGLVQEYGAFGKPACDKFKELGKTRKDFVCPDGFKAGRSYTRNLNAFQVRANCLGASFAGKSDGSDIGDAMLADRFQCQALDDTHNFSLEVGGPAVEWNRYHAVIAKNYVPYDNNGTNYLCGGGDRNVNEKSGAALSRIELGTTNKTTQALASKGTQGVKDKGLYNEGLKRDTVNDSCVIYVAEGGVFDWDAFKDKTIRILDGLELKENGQKVPGTKAFESLHLYFVEGYAMKDPMSDGANKTRAVNRKGKKVKVKGMPVDELPLKYVDFEEYYILRKGNTSKNKDSFNDEVRHFSASNNVTNGLYVGADGQVRGSVGGGAEVDAVRGYCQFSTFRITATAIDSLDIIEAVLTFDPTIHGANAGGIKVTLDFPDTNIMGVTPVGEQAAVENGVGTKKFYFKPTPEQKEVLAVKAQGLLTAKWRADFQKKLSLDEATYGENNLVVVQLPEREYKEPQKIAPFRDQPQIKDPTIPSPKPSPVYLFDDVIEIPSSNEDLLNPEIRGRVFAQEYTKQFGLCKDLGDIGRAKVVQIDAETLKLLEDAKKAYDKVNKENPTLATELKYFPEDITVANLLDAMSIVKGDIPLNAVCLLGKTIGAASKDKIEGNNMFGSFAAYMGPDSSFFPANLKEVNGEVVADNRFIGCVEGKDNGNKQYHYGHYNWNWIKLGDQSIQKDRQPFEQKLKDGPWKDAPLAPIAEAVGFKRSQSWQSSWGKIKATSSMDKYNRRDYHKAYENIFQKEGSCGLEGYDMPYEQVVAYINALCTAGPSAKPTNGNHLECGQRYEADTINAPSTLK